MKRKMSFLWIFLAAVTVFAGWFFPEFALTKAGTPNFPLNYQTVEVSSQDSTDYFWRLKTAVRNQMGITANMESPGFQETVITDRYTEEEQGILTNQALKEARTLVDAGVFPSTVLDMMREAVSQIEVLYLFDSNTLRGFPYVRFYFYLDRDEIKGSEKTAYTYQTVFLNTDLSSGKIFGLSCYGFPPEEIEKGYADEGWFWHDPLRSFADYLGLGADTSANLEGESAPEADDYVFADTVGIQGVESPDGNGWFELRVMQNAIKEYFSLALYRCTYES